jgi:hypothetical protein
MTSSKFNQQTIIKIQLIQQNNQIFQVNLQDRQIKPPKRRSLRLKR